MCSRFTFETSFVPSGRFRARSGRDDVVDANGEESRRFESWCNIGEKTEDTLAGLGSGESPNIDSAACKKIEFRKCILLEYLKDPLRRNWDWAIVHNERNKVNDSTYIVYLANPTSCTYKNEDLLLMKVSHCFFVAIGLWCHRKSEAF